MLRATWKSAALPLFVHAQSETGNELIANPRVARRWFSGSDNPPGPIPEPFAAHKAPHELRIFALGESTTAGFPYPHNGTFSRMVLDALHDVLPSDSVEVINLGIAATSSYSMLDEADEIIAQHPDAVLIYAGHNEYYGALGVGSTESVLGGSPTLVRAYLRLQRLRLVYALRLGVDWLRGALSHSSTADAEHNVTMMEVLARNQQIELGDATYRRGENQFQQNLNTLLDKFRAAHVAVFIASQASNLRDQHPFVAPANARPGAADSVFARAKAAFASGDSTQARVLFTRARDLDVVRFRASSALDSIIKTTAAAHGAIYVPVEERIAAVSPAGVPGYDYFLEHLHPNEQGTTIIAQAFFDALRDAHFLGHTAQLDRLRPWSVYRERMDLTPFDERVVNLSTRAVTSRWPFVPVNQQVDFRRAFHPASLLDSLALAVSAGASWQSAKLHLARAYEARGFADSAVAEFRGLVRDAPTFAEPWEFLGNAFERAGEPDSALAAYRRALAIQPSVAVENAAAGVAMQRHDYPTAITLLQASLTARPNDARAIYQLSLAYALSHDVENARAMAARLARIAPTFPGLRDWLSVLGMTR